MSQYRILTRSFTCSQHFLTSPVFANTQPPHTDTKHIVLAHGMNDERRAKLQRLDTFRRKIPHVTEAALEVMIRTAHAEGLPDIGDRTDFCEARSARNEPNLTSDTTRSI